MDGLVEMPKLILLDADSWRWPAAGLFIQAMRDFSIRHVGDVLLVTTQDKARRAARSLGIAVADGQTNR